MNCIGTIGKGGHAARGTGPVMMRHLEEARRHWYIITGNYRTGMQGTY